MNFKASKKAKMRKGAKNFVAVLTALSLVFLQTPVVYADDAVTDEGKVLSEQAVETQAETVDVGLSFEHAYIEYDGQVIAEPAESVTVPSDADFTFTAVADNGFTVTSVEATVGDSTDELGTEAGEYTLSADDIAGGDASVSVVAEPEEAEEPAEGEATEGEEAEGEGEEGVAPEAEGDGAEAAEGEQTASAAEEGETAPMAEIVTPEGTEAQPSQDGAKSAASAEAATADASKASAQAAESGEAAKAESGEAASAEKKSDDEPVATDAQTTVDERAEAATVRTIAAMTGKRKLGAASLAAQDAGPYTSHQVDINFFAYGGETPAAFESPNDDKYYVVATLTDKGTGAQGNLKAWAIQEVNPNNKESLTLSFKDFYDYTRHQGNVQGDTKIVTYDSSLYDINVRLMHAPKDKNIQNYRILMDQNTKAQDTIDGYEITSPVKGDDKTVVKVAKGASKAYQVQFEFDQDGSAFTASDLYYLFVTVQHATGNPTYYMQKLEMPASGTQTIAINEWYEEGGSVKQGEKYTGNEVSVTAQLLQADQAINISEAKNKNHCVVVGEGNTAKGYMVHIQPNVVETDNTTGVETRTDKFVMTKTTATSDYNFKSVLGNALYYGITANQFEQKNHIQSNFAVNEYILTDQKPIEPDLSGRSSGAIIVGSLSQAGNRKIQIGQSTLGSVVMYLGGPTATKRNVQDDSKKAALIESTTAELQDNYVKPMIAYGESMSQELLGHAANYVPAVPEEGKGSKIYIDTTAYPDNATIYIDADAISRFIGTAGGLNIKKKENQVIVFNFDSTTNQVFSEYYVDYDGTGYKKTDTPMAKNDPHNAEIDKIARTIVWNAASVTNATVEIGTGMFLLPNSSSQMDVKGTSSGWIVSSGYVKNTGGEWHSVYSELPEVDDTTLHAAKTVDNGTPKANEKFKFAIDRYDKEQKKWVTITDNLTNDKRAIEYTISAGQYLQAGDNTYRIREVGLAEGTTGSYDFADPIYVNVKYEQVKGDNPGNSVMVARAPEYYKDFDEENGVASGERYTTPTFANTSKTEERDASGSTSFTAHKQYKRVLANGAESDGGVLKAEGFEFELYQGTERTAENLLQTKKNTADGTVAFDAIEYTLADLGGDTSKTFTYTIVEKIPDGATDNGNGTWTKGNITYSGAVITKTVTVTDNGTENLVVDVATSGGADDTFKNTYTAQGQAQVEAIKYLQKSGSETAAPASEPGKYQFVLTQDGGSYSAIAYANGSDTAEDVSADDVGKAKFAPITYTLDDMVDAQGNPVTEKTFTYKVREVVPEGAVNNVFEGVTYDTHEETVTVKVTDNGSGTLATEVTYDDNGASFTNNYDAKGDISLEASKKFNGKEPGDKASQFTFSLTGEGINTALTGTCAEDGKVTFPKIDYKLSDLGGAASKEFTYTIKENIPDGAKKNDNGTWTLDGYTYDGHEAKVTVTVTDNGKGTLTTEVTKTEGSTEFSNSYHADASTHFEANKTYDGVAPAEGKFSFDLFEGDNPAEDATPIQTKDNGANGIAVFDSITYSEAGTFKYTIREKVPEGATKQANGDYTKDGITYDGHSELVTVEVTDANGDGALEAVAQYDNTGVAFSNTYSASGTDRIDASKELAGRNFRVGDSFEFNVRAIGENAPEAPAFANSTIKVAPKDKSELLAKRTAPLDFGAVNFTQAHAGKTFTYEVTESGSGAGVENDKSAYTVEISVADNGDGTLAITKTYKKGNDTVGGIVFTNTYDAKGSAELEANKVLENRELSAGEFTFELRDSSGKVIQTKTNAAGTAVEAAEGEEAPNAYSGAVKFDSIDYKLADLGDDGTETFTYTIREVAGTLGGVTYDDAVKTVTVTVTDNGDGTLETAVSYGDEGSTFTNTYAASGHTAIEGTKVVTGRTFHDGDSITFTLTPENGAPMPKDENGNAKDEVTTIITPNAGTEAPFSLGQFDYTLADAGNTYIYRVEESATMDGTTADPAEHFVYVTVGNDKKTGELDVTKEIKTKEGESEETVESLVFTNAYDASGEAKLFAQKDLSGRALNADEFTFVLTGDGIAEGGIEAKANAEGKAEFAPIPYKLEDMVDAEGNRVTQKEFTYTIKEVLPEDDDPNTAGIQKEGVTYDEHPETVKVTVTDNGKGDLVATYGGANEFAGAPFKNTYAASGNVELTAKKALEGHDLEEGQFTFEVYEGENPAADAKPIRTARNTKEGSIAFDAINYTLADMVDAQGNRVTEKELVYTIKEAVSEMAGYTLDTDVLVAKVKLIDDGKGTLNATVTYVGDTTFTNKYEASGEVTLTANKALVGRTLEAEQFEFQLVDVTNPKDEKLLETVKNAANGTISFSTIEYSKKGEYKYQIREVKGNAKGYTYAEDPIDVTVTVTDNGDGTLKAVAAYPENRTFTNTYKAAGDFTFEGTKTISNRSFKEGDEFTFTLTPVDGAPMPKGEDGKALSEVTKTIAPKEGESADIKFGKVDYALADLDGATSKTFTYTVTETANIDGVTNDSPTTVEVTVTDNGKGKLETSAVYKKDGEAVDALVFANAYDAKGTFTLEGQKTITGRDFKSGDSMTFTVTVSEGAPMPKNAQGEETTETTINPTAGKTAPFSFGTIQFGLADVAKTKDSPYVYTVTETAELAGVTVDEAHTVEITVTDNGDGTLTATPMYKRGDKKLNGLDFTNKYRATGQADLFAAKTLTGLAPLQKGKFSFQLYKGTELTEENLLQTKANGDDGAEINRAVFDPVSYTEADAGKSYTYTIKEVVPEGADESNTFEGYTYDPTPQSVTVSIADKGDGTLAVTYNPAKDGAYAGASFTNAYAAKGSVKLEAEKKVEGDAQLVAGEFSFQLLNEKGEVIQTKPNKDDGSVEFDAIEYAAPGTYNYSIREVNDGKFGFTYDKKVSNVVVKVEDKALNGELEVTTTYDGKDERPVFTNTYGAAGKFTIDAEKSITGRTFKEGDKFTFTVSAPEGTPMPKNTKVTIEPTEGNTAKIDFGEISYTLADVDKTKDKPYVYTISETAKAADAEEDGLEYDAFPHTVSVKVEWAGEGNLTVTPEYSDGEAVTLTNKYSAEGEANLFATKTLEGRELGDNEFFFTLTGDGIPEGGLHASANADGVAAFEPIKYTLDDNGKDFHYTITEDKGNLPGITYDGTKHEVTVHVEDDSSGTMKVTYDGKDTFAGAPFKNSYAATGEAQLYATKNFVSDSGVAWPYGEGEFQFTLSENGKLIQGPIGNDVNGRVTFEPIAYTLEDVGKHTYEIAEVEGDLPNVEYDTDVRTVVVDVAYQSADTDKLKVTYDGKDSFGGVAFTNTYSATGEIAIDGKKKVTGREFHEGDKVTFTLTPIDGAPMPKGEGGEALEQMTATITPTEGFEKGFSFDPIGYTLADAGKTYQYKVVEEAEMAGTTPDPAEHIVNVAVAPDTRTGSLEVTKTVTVKNGETEQTLGALEFTNAYSAEGEANLFAIKDLTGRALGEGEFSFTLSENGEALQESVPNGADGRAEFAAIPYTLADVGEHTYTITEDEGELPGVTYDKTPQTVRVDVSDNGDGTLKVTYNGKDTFAGARFKNAYNAEGAATFEVQKLVEGHDLIAGKFTFEVYEGEDPAEDAEPILSGTNDADGNIEFGDVDYTIEDAGKTFAYTIKEFVPAGAEDNTLAGYTYDTDVVVARVAVTDNGNGTLATNVTYDDNDTVFTNTYEASGDVALKATKELTGRTLEAEQFTFELVDVTNPDAEKVLQTKKNAANGSIDFDKIEYSAPGDYAYQIREKDDEQPGYTYADAPINVTVKVVDNGDGTLTATETYPDGTVFKNAYDAKGSFTFAGQKTISNRAFREGDSFTFTVTAADGVPMPANPEVTITPKEGESAAIEFGDVEYKLEDLGGKESATFEYTVTETADIAGVTNDVATSVVVTVTDNGAGELQTSATYTKNGEAVNEIAFANTYAAEGKAQLHAKKNFVTQDGDEWPYNAGDFQFTLSEGDKVLQTVGNDAEGVASFEPIKYTLDDVGEHTYTIAEVAGNLPDVTYDTTEHKVVVNVSDNGDGTLKVTYNGEDAYSGAEFTNTFRRTVTTHFEFDKYYFGGTDTFDFTLAAADAEGNVREGDSTSFKAGDEIVDNGQNAFTVTAKNGPYGEGNLGKIVFPEITYEQPDGDYYYLVYENATEGSDMIPDEASYLVHVTEKGYEVGEPTYELIYQGENYGKTDDLAFYNNGTVQFGFNSLARQGMSNGGQRASVYPRAQKYINGATDLLVGDDFTFELIDAETGKTIATATNDENGEVAFFDEETEYGLVFTEPGVYRYIIREVQGDEAAITYDKSEITLTVTVTANDEGALDVEELYNGPGGSEPAFYNTREGIDVRVQKVSRSGGEGLEGSTYALWMVGESGDALIQEAVSDAEGYITFTDVNLIAGQKYYFKEVAAPAGHTVDPYRTAYFSLNETGDALVLAEKTADDGWHSADDSAELNEQKAGQ